MMASCLLQCTPGNLKEAHSPVQARMCLFISELCLQAGMLEAEAADEAEEACCDRHARNHGALRKHIWRGRLFFFR